MDSKRISRRGAMGMLAGAIAASSAPWFVPASALGKEDRPAPSNRRTMGIIGLGSMGMRNLLGFLQENDCQVTAVCDLDSTRRRDGVAATNKHYGDEGCAAINDFRELIARLDIDLLCISVPDHWHSVVSIAGIRAGKHIYGEKPLALTIAEGRTMVNEVRRYGTVWQTGSWQRSTICFREACELVRNGRIGKVRRVEVGIGVGPTTTPQPVMPVPEGFDYEMWLGPAPWAPYTEKRCHWNFRWILDYSGGQVTDWGAHHIDIAQWGMGTEDTGPVEVEGSGVFPASLWDAATTYHFECRYANGIELVVASENELKNGIKFIGESGWVHVDRQRFTVSSPQILKDPIGPGEIHLYKSPMDRQGHRRNFLDCVRDRSTPAAEIGVAHRSIAIAHLGNIAMRLGRKITWDPATETIANDEAATRMLSRPMRGDWGR